MTTPSTALAQAKTGGLAAFTATSNPFLKATDKVGVSDGLFLRLNGKTGKFVSNYPDMSEFEPGTELVFDLYNATLLWQGFDNDNKPFNGPAVTLISGADLPPHQELTGVKWTKQMRVMVALTDGGKQMSFTAKADTPFRSIWRLVKKYGEQLTRFPDPSSKTGYMSPVVRIDSEEKKTKKMEEKVRMNPQTGQREIYEEEVAVQYFVDKFEVTGWITQKEMEEVLESQAAAVADAGPADVAAQVSAPAADQAAPQGTVEIIPPAAGAQGGFRRNRVGQRV